MTILADIDGDGKLTLPSGPVNRVAHIASTSLVTLADDINREHQAAEAAARFAITHALQAGRLLIEAKGQLRHGEWLPWLAANCTVSERQAQNYMRLAENWTAIEAKSAPGADLTVKGALRLLDERRADDHGTAKPSYKTIGQWTVDQRRSHCAHWWDAQAKYVLLLEAAGMDAAEIATFLGIHEDNDVWPILAPRPQIRGQDELDIFFRNVNATTYAEYVWEMIHGWLGHACHLAAWCADHEGYGDTRERLEHDAAKHERLRQRVASVPHAYCVDEYTHTQLGLCTLWDARRAVGIEPPKPVHIMDMVLPNDKTIRKALSA